VSSVKGNLGPRDTNISSKAGSASGMNRPGFTKTQVTNPVPKIG